jgi:hypothetical protein
MREEAVTNAVETLAVEDLWEEEVFRRRIGVAELVTHRSDGRPNVRRSSHRSDIRFHHTVVAAVPAANAAFGKCLSDVEAGRANHGIADNVRNPVAFFENTGRGEVRRLIKRAGRGLG